MFYTTMLKTVFAALIFRFSLASFPKTRDANTSDVDVEFCSTPACQRAASRYAASIDASLDPCDDFYEFVCSGWKQRHTRKGITYWSNILEQVEFVWGQIHQILKKANGSEREVERKVGNFYKGCINQKKREKLGFEPLRHVLKEIGGWPLIGDEFDENNYNWMDALTWISRNTGISDIVLGVFAEPYYFILYALFFVPLKTDLDTRIGPFLEDSQVLDFANRLQHKATPSIKEESEKVLEFQESLNKLRDFHRHDSLDKIYYRTICEMQEKVGDGINITSYLQNTLEGVIPVTDETMILFTYTPFVKRVMQLVEDTDKRVVANYIGWTVVKKLGYYTAMSIPNNTLELGTEEENTKLQKRCLHLTDKLLEGALENIYVKYNFDSNCKEDLTEMMKLIKGALRDVFENSEWMDNQTRDEAIDKLDRMSAIIGYPDWILSDSEADEYYKTLGDLNEDNFFQSAIDVVLFHRKKKLMKQGTYVSFPRRFHPPLKEVNAKYNLGGNLIYLPAAMAQLPRYEYGLPAYITYASMGYVLGHEMTHGFDIIGHTVDANRNRRDWWTANAKDKYNNKTECFIRQYGNYEPMEGVKLNSERTAGEDVADNGAVGQAFTAWKKYVSLHGNDNNELLPLLDYTREQLFFIAYAYMWCDIEEETSLREAIRDDPHSPAKYRVLGPLSNNREFHKAFNCKEGHSMYRKDTCQLW